MMGKKFFTYMLLAVMATSCGEYQEVLKSKDLDFKFGKAVEYYEAGEYNKAYPIFDELITLYRGTEKAQEVYFYYANTLYLQKDYILAGYSRISTNLQTSKQTKAYPTAYCYFRSAYAQLGSSLHLQSNQQRRIINTILIG